MEAVASREGCAEPGSVGERGGSEFLATVVAPDNDSRGGSAGWLYLFLSSHSSHHLAISNTVLPGENMSLTRKNAMHHVGLLLRTGLV